MEKLDFILKQAYYMSGATITEVTSENEIRTRMLTIQLCQLEQTE